MFPAPLATAYGRYRTGQHLTGDHRLARALAYDRQRLAWARDVVEDTPDHDEATVLEAADLLTQRSRDADEVAHARSLSIVLRFDISRRQEAGQ